MLINIFHSPLKTGISAMYVQGDSPAIAKDRHGKLAAASRMDASGQVVIPVDCVVPDMAGSMDGDSGQLHTVGQKYVATGYSRQADTRPSPSQQGHVQHSPEPVVDLSIPMHTNQEYMAAAYAPRQGQDIFDTWCACLLKSFCRLCCVNVLDEANMAFRFDASQLTAIRLD